MATSSSSASAAADAGAAAVRVMVWRLACLHEDEEQCAATRVALESDPAELWKAFVSDTQCTKTTTATNTAAAFMETTEGLPGLDIPRHVTIQTTHTNFT